MQMEAPLPGQIVTARAIKSELDKDAEAFMAAQRKFG